MRLISFLLACLLTALATPAPARAWVPERFAFVRGGDLWLDGSDQPITTGGVVREPRFSPDGMFLSYYQEAVLHVRSLSRGELWSVPGTWGYTWSPASRMIALTGEGGVHTLAVTFEGLGEPQMVARGWWGGAWSPDGRRLAVSRTLPTGKGHLAGVAEVGIVPAAGGPVRVILREEYGLEGQGCGGGASALSWSPDGKWLLLGRHGVTASISADCNEFAVMPSGGGKPVTLGAAANLRWAVWAPRHAALLAYVDGVGREAWKGKQLRLIAPPWQTPREPITPVGFADRDPAWDLTGRHLAFTRSREEAPANMLTGAAPGQMIYRLHPRRPPARSVLESEGGLAPFWSKGGALFWFRLGRSHVDLFRDGRPFIRNIDLVEPYYGQWDWHHVFDYWSG